MDASPQRHAAAKPSGKQCFTIRNDASSCRFYPNTGLRSSLVFSDLVCYPESGLKRRIAPKRICLCPPSRPPTDRDRVTAHPEVIRTRHLWKCRPTAIPKGLPVHQARSEERRVGKEGRTRWSPYD